MTRAALRNALAAAALLLLPAASATPRRAGAASAADPGALSPPAAYRRALELMQGPEPTASLPYFRRAVQSAAAPARAHLEYSWMLNDAAIATRPRLGRVTRAARSSLEQVGLELASLRELERAERISRDPAERALILAYRGKHLEVWGLPWDAVAAYRTAAEIDPAWSAGVTRTENRLRHPGAKPAPAADPGRP